MKASYRWLQSYFEKELPSPEMVADTLTFHAFEVEHVEKIGDDTIFDIDILPNRTHDCLSHLGVARELSVLLNMPLKQDVMREKEKQLPLSRTLSVSVENPLMCRRYMAGVIRGARIAPSPQWLQERLLSIGQKSINNVVDATNYVMFSLGQPLHAFDARKLAEENGMHIIVRSAKKGETITLLSGEEHTLSPDHLLIADGHSGLPLGIAGVKGGVTADIDEKTEDIIIESANFNPTSIRKTSRHFEIRTDASIRFENELAPELAYYGITEAVNLILEIAGGDVEGYVDAYPKRMTMQYKVGMSLSEVNQLLGASITAKEIEKTLTSLGYVYEKVSPIEKVLSLAPSLKGIPYTPIGAIRYDNGKQFSCSSFTNYLFVEGGVALPSVSIDQYAYGMPVGASDIQPGDLIFFNSKTGAVRYETVGYMKGTAVPEGVDHCALYIGEENMIHAAREQGMVVEEKISDSKQYKDIIGYRRMTDNKKRYVVKIPFERLDVRVKEDLIEEIGRIYGYQNIPALIPEQNSIQPDINKSFYYAEKIRRFLTDRGFTEVYTYSMRNFGQIEIENPLAGDKSFLRDGLHYGVEEGIARNQKNLPLFGVNDVNLFEIGKIFKGSTEHLKEYTALCIGSSAKENAEKAVQALSSELGIVLGGVWSGGVCECNLDVVLDALPEPTFYEDIFEHEGFSYRPFSIYPFVLRDIAVWAPEEVDAQELESRIKEHAGNLLVRISFFDEYKKDKRVSYAFQLVFQSSEKTLSDKEVNEIMESVTTSLHQNKGFEVR